MGPQKVRVNSLFKPAVPFRRTLSRTISERQINNQHCCTLSSQHTKVRTMYSINPAKKDQSKETETSNRTTATGIQNQEIQYLHHACLTRPLARAWPSSRWSVGKAPAARAPASGSSRALGIDIWNNFSFSVSLNNQLCNSQLAPEQCF